VCLQRHNHCLIDDDLSDVPLLLHFSITPNQRENLSLFLSYDTDFKYSLNKVESVLFEICSCCGDSPPFCSFVTYDCVKFVVNDV